MTTQTRRLFASAPSVLVVALAAGCSTEPVETDNQAASLPGSIFEIDDDANLTVEGPEGALDWAIVDDVKKPDVLSGKDDDSYAGGSKEDDACPGTTTGSIPNNKSDLKWFGVYEESGSPGFLHFFWSRVQEPNGTTLMDFELNQESEDCGNGVNPVRTVGDLLLEYRIEQGGAHATIKVREWDGSAWGDALDLTAIGAATGTINDSAIADADSDGLGPHSPRTFGEASINLDFIFDEEQCTSFGSVFVKSRASDSFQSQLKDFIAPEPISISNCGRVIIRKETDPDQATDSFSFSHNLATDPPSGASFALADGESRSFSNVLLNTGYYVTEDVLADGYELEDINCDASSGVEPVIDLAGGSVTFDIDEVDDVLDCTFTNQARGTIVIEKVTNDGSGSFAFTSGSLGGFTLATAGPGVLGMDSTTFADKEPGTYDVAEVVPAGWNLVSATCDDGSLPSAIDLDAGETVTCRFTNARQLGAIVITKTRKHAADGPGDHPHPGVTFQITGGELTGPVSVVTQQNGVACADGLVLSSFVGGYNVTELVPPGYVADGATTKAVSVTAEASCPAGDAVAFGNTPLTNITISVDSQVNGGTASTISCTGGAFAATAADGDGTLSLANLLPSTYTCTIVVDP